MGNNNNLNIRKALVKIQGESKNPSKKISKGIILQIIT